MKKKVVDRKRWCSSCDSYHTKRMGCHEDLGFLLDKYIEANGGAEYVEESKDEKVKSERD